MTETPAPLPELGPIVVGFDGSAQGEDALGLALWFTRILDVPLVVAAVHPSAAAISPARVDAEWVADRHRLAERVLDGARSRIDALTGPPKRIEYRIVASSSAAHGLLDLAEELTASLIVVGSGSRATEERLFAGSTAERLLSGSPCPVAVAPSGARNRSSSALTRIGVAYIDVPEATAALEVAARLARRTSAELRLYTVVADEAEVLPLLIGRDAERAFLATAREQYQFALDTAIAGLPPGVQATGQILTGDVVEVLAELDEDHIDVLFCGSRGYGPVRSVLLGGVSSRLVRTARSPLVVVPRGS
ncbi:MAG TPA: universal stress protein [Micromonosporaceae bacterium]|jgi:nucleotide-binding universal stress UspA family protein